MIDPTVDKILTLILIVIFGLCFVPFSVFLINTLLMKNYTYFSKNKASAKYVFYLMALTVFVYFAKEQIYEELQIIDQMFFGSEN